MVVVVHTNPVLVVRVERVTSTRSLGSLEMALHLYALVSSNLLSQSLNPPRSLEQNARWQKHALKIHPLKFYPTYHPTP